MEMVIWAHFSQDEVLINAIESGLDLHSLTAAGQHGLKYEEFIARLDAGDLEVKEWRAVGKTSNFGALYGIGAKKFQRFLLVHNGVLVSLDESQRLLDAIDQTYPQGYEWKQRVARFIAKNGYVLTMERRKRRLPKALDGLFWEKREAERQGINAVIQGSCGDIICKCMPAIQSMLKGMDGTLLLQVHDELVGEVPKQYAELAAKTMSELMVGFVNPYLNCRLQAEVHIGESWGAAKG
jgi:DNA polymerase-1